CRPICISQNARNRADQAVFATINAAMVATSNKPPAAASTLRNRAKGLVIRSANACGRPGLPESITSPSFVLRPDERLRLDPQAKRHGCTPQWQGDIIQRAKR